jgi:glucose-1-phosphate thymidylyltransferase
VEKIGLIPAAGIAKRLGSLAFSKELLPIGFKAGRKEPGLKAVSTYLLEKFYQAGINKVYTVVRKGKWDILNYYGDGREIGIPLAYLIMAYPFGVPYTLDQAYPFVKTSKVFLGFPDILFEPENAFTEADAALGQNCADLTLGLYPVSDKRQIQKSDMVQFETDGRITQIIVKPETTDLKFSWVFAIWKPDFTLFMHDYLKHDLAKRQKNSNQAEIHLGHVIQAAIESGLSVFGHLFADFNFIDVGNPENLAEALKKFFFEKD